MPLAFGIACYLTDRAPPWLRRPVGLLVARIAGETAPLLFTGAGHLNWSVAMNQPMASLPVTIYQYAGSAFDDWV